MPSLPRRSAAEQVAIVGTRYALLDYEEQTLAQRGVHLVRGSGADADGLVDLCRAAAVCLIGSAPRFTADVLARLPRLRGIVRYGVGVDNVDLPEARRRGVLVAYVPDYCIDEVATHAVTLILACTRKLWPAWTGVRRGGWGIQELRPLHSPRCQTVGVVGLGRIGRAVIDRLRPFGFRLLGHDPYVGAAQVTALGAEPADLETLLGASDVVTLHLPLTPATHHVLGPAQFRLMKPAASLVNTSRGGLVDESALCQALAEGRLGGAALDVLEEEPPSPARPILARPEVLVTPHMSWYTDEAEMDLRRKGLAEALRMLDGSPLLHPAS